MSKLDIFPLVCAADKVWITDHELTLIHKNIRSVHNSHAQELTLIQKTISQCDIKHILTSQINTITPVLKILIYGTLSLVLQLILSKLATILVITLFFIYLYWRAVVVHFVLVLHLFPCFRRYYLVWCINNQDVALYCIILMKLRNIMYKQLNYFSVKISRIVKKKHEPF